MIRAFIFIQSITDIFVLSEVNHVQLPVNLQCKKSEYFDFAGLMCSTCNDKLETTSLVHDQHGNAVGCSCTAGMIRNKNICSLEKMKMGSCDQEQSCDISCSDQFLVASLDHAFCVSCNSQQGTTSGSSFDSTSRDCSCNNPTKTPNDQNLIFSRRLVEIYDPVNALPTKKECFQCPKGTAVITDEVVGNNIYHHTAGEKYKANPYYCAKCPDRSMYFNKEYDCVCNTGLVKVGESSVGAQSCIRHKPTISNNYAKVEFNIIQNGRKNGLKIRKRTIDSIVFSHFYIKSASMCEFIMVDNNLESFQACQTLANLCVMNMYDEASAPCRQFLSIIKQKRLNSYHAQEDWKFSLPWLYYLDEPDDITEDRGINMMMSFSKAANRVERMNYKIVKYDLNGQFKGIYDVTNEFFFCSTGGPLGGESTWHSKTDLWKDFGRNYQFEYICDLNKLLGSEMFFYDLFVVDSSPKSCPGQKDSSECIYPVPVLIRNFVEGEFYPNINSKKDDENNDRYTRRFFFYDNMSGRSSSGNLEIIRYAKKIILQNTVQMSQPNKIYPPRLIIEYDEIEIDKDTSYPEIFKSEKFTASLQFKAEYTMNTKHFWTVIKAVFSFIIAICVVVWVKRTYQWLARNNTTSGFWVGLKSTTFLCHTIAIFGFIFILSIGSFFFVFFKLQEEIYIMLPSVGEFEGLDNEYFVFSLFLQIIFWSHTVYIAHLIYCQCQVDIFFIDWEKSRGRYTDVSTWRMIMIVNEWNRLQTARKTSIELNLLFLAFLMIGLDFYGKFSSSQPNFSHDSNSNINVILRFTGNCFLWIILSILQWIWRVTLFERIFREPVAQRFIDLSTIAKISIFIKDEELHGYYLHCRSPYEQADCSMAELCHQINKEERGVANDRGLDTLGAPINCQTFEVYLSFIFARQLERGFALNRRHKNELYSQRNREDHEENVTANRLESSHFFRQEVTEFLKNFVDQSPIPQIDGLKYTVREQDFMEKLVGGSPPDVQSKDSQSILYTDNLSWRKEYAFLNTTFLGIELNLLFHDILVYNVCELFFESPSLSILITYLTNLARIFVRNIFGTKNLSDKAMIDERFIH